MGKIIKKKMVGNNFMIQIARFRDEYNQGDGRYMYQVYALRRTPNGWIESQAVARPSTLKEATKDFNDHKSIDMILLLHPALRASPGSLENWT